MHRRTYEPSFRFRAAGNCALCATKLSTTGVAITGRSNGQALQSGRDASYGPTDGLKGPLEAARWADWGCTTTPCGPIIGGACIVQCAPYVTPCAWRSEPASRKMWDLTSSAPGGGYIRTGETGLVRPPPQSTSPAPPPRSPTRRQRTQAKEGWSRLSSRAGVTNHPPSVRRTACTTLLRTPHTAAEARPTDHKDGRHGGKGGLAPRGAARAAAARPFPLAACRPSCRDVCSPCGAQQLPVLGVPRGPSSTAAIPRSTRHGSVAQMTLDILHARITVRRSM